jgi:hypothetical protein
MNGRGDSGDKESGLETKRKEGRMRRGKGKKE